MTREEAIHIIETTKYYSKKNYSEFCEALSILVPELYESEDERIRKYLMEWVALSDNSMKEECFSWLEKQKEQKSAELPSGVRIEYDEDGVPIVNPKQKPAEWSEEDEEVIKLIESSTWDGEKLTQGEAGVVHRWLKDLPNRFSIRLRWKPSEEQIKALESCFCEFGEGCPDEDCLRSLYNDLRKL